MKTLSESLDALAARVKQLEQSAAASFESDRAKLEQRGREIDQAFADAADDVERTLRQADEAGRARWNETKASVKRPVDELRARVQARRTEHELHRAQRHAEAADEDAIEAIGLATYFVNVAEYAVIDAALARMEADDLAASTAGASS
jgi:hypothetical protein